MDIPVSIMAIYIAVTLFIGSIGIVMALRKISGAPFITVFAGILFFVLIVLTTNVETAYSEEIDYILEYPMNVTTSTGSIQLANTNFGAGENVVNPNSALNNTPISCVIMDLSKTGAPTGTATIGVLGGAGNIIRTISTLDVTTLTTSQKSYQFCLPNHDYFTLGLYQRVGIFYNLGTAGNGVNVYLDSGNPFDGNNSDRSTLSSSLAWTNVAGSDMKMVLTYDKADVIGEPIKHPFNQNDSWAFLIFLSALFIFIGVIFQYQEWHK